MFGFGKGGRKGRNPPELPETEEPKPDLSGDFRIVIPTNITIPISPLDTFSERVIKAYDVQQALVRKNVRSSIFQPMPNGRLRVFPHEKGTKNQ